SRYNQAASQEVAQALTEIPWEDARTSGFQLYGARFVFIHGTSHLIFGFEDTLHEWVAPILISNRGTPAAPNAPMALISGAKLVMERDSYRFLAVYVPAFPRGHTRIAVQKYERGRPGKLKSFRWAPIASKVRIASYTGDINFVRQNLAAAVEYIATKVPTAGLRSLLPTQRGRGVGAGLSDSDTGDGGVIRRPPPPRAA
ncbi:unnamed protein product, partial [Phaeothamnion confervicola]